MLRLCLDLRDLGVSAQQRLMLDNLQDKLKHVCLGLRLPRHSTLLFLDHPALFRKKGNWECEQSFPPETSSPNLMSQDPQGSATYSNCI